MTKKRIPPRISRRHSVDMNGWTEYYQEIRNTRSRATKNMLDEPDRGWNPDELEEISTDE